MSTRIVREAYGPSTVRGRATAVVQDGVTQRVVRDRHGRLVGLEGPSRADALQAAIDQLAVDSAELEDRLQHRLLAMEGWVKLPALGLMCNLDSLSRLCRAYEIGGAQIRVRWHTPASPSGSGSDGWYGQESGADGAGEPIVHVVNVRLGVDVDRMTYVIKHEYAHVAQAVRIGASWDAAVRDILDELEAEAREMAKSVDHIELVRAL